MESKWHVTQLTQEDEAIAHELSSVLGVSAVLGKLLVLRGIRTEDGATRYLHPSLTNLHDPFLMADMDRAVQRIGRALDERRPIMIYGDHDVDGTTSVALLYSALRDLHEAGDLLHYYIPSHEDEGYGISRAAIHQTSGLGGDLLIAIDCGIKALEEIAYARSLGIDVIVCDHHQPDQELPAAYAILDPRQSHCSYPCPDLSGCGVGYKLMQALAIARGVDPRSLYAYLDLVAISIAADLVPLTDENRILLYHGLKQLNSHPSIGVRAIMQIAGLEGKHCDVGSIIYHIAPRINASGRMMDGNASVAMLTAQDAETARLWSQRLDDYNAQRRAIDQALTLEAEAQIRQQGGLDERKVLILYQSDWHRGVLGIVASRLTERYHRPTLILTRSGEYIIGSGRSMRSVNLYAALEACREHLVNFGGHKHAAGITIEEERIPDFRQALEDYFDEYVAAERLQPVMRVDAQLNIEDITPELRDEIAMMAPFGLKNESPTFVTYRLRDAGGTRLVGQRNQHIKLRMTDRYCKHRPLYGIALGLAEHAPWILRQQSFGICYSLDMGGRVRPSGISPNARRAGESVQLNVKDIHTTG